MLLEQDRDVQIVRPERQNPEPSKPRNRNNGLAIGIDSPDDSAEIQLTDEEDLIPGTLLSPILTRKIFTDAVVKTRTIDERIMSMLMY